MAKILVIDDDPAIVDLLVLRLGEAGHQVASAADALDALTRAAQEKPDLITLDYNIPSGDGVLVYERLRALSATARTPVIFITGNHPSAILPHIGGDSLVRIQEKPIDMPSLLRLIDYLLGKPGSEAAAPDILVHPALKPPPAPPHFDLPGELPKA